MVETVLLEEAIQRNVIDTRWFVPFTIYRLQPLAIDGQITFEVTLQNVLQEFAMTQQKLATVDRSDLPDSLKAAERHKSNLILEANFLQYQGEYEAASDKFAEAATIEESLANQLSDLNKQEKAFVHHFSALSCWVQAGELHHARILGQKLLQSAQLSEAQQLHVTTYLDTLRLRMQRWMSEWQSERVVADD